ncbi:MAG: hypothetical protein ACOVLC_08245 [Flavobacterium sp.]
MRYFAILFLVLMISCDDKKVDLPLYEKTQLKEVMDHSSIYFFYNADAKKEPFLDVNDNNRIGTTNWVFHIDKKISLKEAIPALIGFQNKRAKAEMHKKEDFKHYFSYMDASQKTLAFTDFTTTTYTFNNYFSSQYVKENADYHQHFEIMSVNFLNEKSLYINGESIEMDEMNTYILDYLSFQNNTNKALIYLNFEQNCSFGFYVAQVMKLQEIANEKVLIAPVQFVYDENLLTSCDCK